MTKYIVKNVLNLGNTEKEIKKNLKDLFNFIYHHCPLDHNKMIKLYQHVIAPVNFDDIDSEGDYNDYYRYELTFVSHQDIDKKYIYQFDKEKFNDRRYKNLSMIKEILINNVYQNYLF